MQSVLTIWNWSPGCTSRPSALATFTSGFQSTAVEKLATSPTDGSSTSVSAPLASEWMPRYG